MAVPARRISKAKKNSRRSSVWKLQQPELVACPQCGELKRPHRLCAECGYYNGRKVVSDD